MGQERETTLRIGGDTARGKALLETDEIIFRGERRLVIKRASITKVEAADGELTLTFAGGVASFALGAAAAKWADAITNPKGRLDKIGIKRGAHVVLLGEFDDALRPELDALGCVITTSVPRADASLVMLAARAKKDLARVPTLRAKLTDDGALWIVYPKGRTEIREADVREAGRAAEMTDHKVARFSETHTALKFVIPTRLRSGR